MMQLPTFTNHFLTSLCLCLLTSCSLYAQTPATTAPQGVKYYVYGGVGAGSYTGDLSSYERWGGLFHVGFQNSRRRWFTPRFEVTYGSISGQNSRYDFPDGTPNTFFHTTMLLGAAYAQINIIKTKQLNLYVSQGIGMMKYWIVDKNDIDLVNQNRTRAIGETYATTSLLLPTNIGGVYFFPNDFGVGIEAGWFNTMTDYLDNISKWGKDAGNDNILRIKFSFFAPIKRF